ncbi:Asparagine-rich protein [Mizuhopecten yessoensis]|uniref:Asparagine-rich protein n=1 Tax=Mizuhopecten yessoensis TaxID=6573 RepID=A0A210Q321_MIZYE|nr:Asparagine-rich protein [Mizuhopecten yessoensis]
MELRSRSVADAGRLLLTDNASQVQPVIGNVQQLCTKNAVSSKPQDYMENGITLVCADGTRFDESECQCVFDPSFTPSTECFPEMVINYDADKESRFDVKHDTDVRKVRGGGKFSSKDKSSTKVDHYNGNGNLLKHFNMTLIFKSESTGNSKQFLITNCRATETDQPSIGIMVSNINGMLLFVADDNATAPSSIKMKLKFKKGSWNWVRYIFDGRTLQAMVVPLPDHLADPSTVTEFYSNNVTLAAPSEDPVMLLSSQNPLTIGYCNGHGYDGLVYRADLAPWVCSMYMDSLSGL